MISEHIVSLGIELEGGMKPNTRSIIETKFSKWGLNLNVAESGDGSVHRSYDWPASLVTTELKFFAEKLIDIKHFLEWSYKYGDVRTNSSCGMHVHVMFTNHSYTLFALARQPVMRDFHNKYREHFKDNQKYLGRLSNRFCKENNLSTGRLVQSMVHSNYERYYSVNFASTRKHSVLNIEQGKTIRSPGTLEIRVLPGQDTAKEAYSSILWLVEALEDIIRTYVNYRVWIKIF